MNLRTCLVVSLLLGAASTHALACYTVYNEQDRVVYQGMMGPPVDMSVPLHEALPAGWHMIFNQDEECRAVDFAQFARPAGPSVPPNTAVMANRPPVQPRTSPLLTDRRTAAAQKLPYRVLSGDVVVVPPEVAPTPPVSKPSAPSDLKIIPRFVPAGLEASSEQTPNEAPNTVITELDDPLPSTEPRAEKTQGQ